MGMEAALLVQKLGEVGITLRVEGGKIVPTSAKPIPQGIMTTINAERKRLIKHLEATVDEQQGPPLIGAAKTADDVYNCRQSAPTSEAQPHEVLQDVQGLTPMGVTKMSNMLDTAGATQDAQSSLPMGNIPEKSAAALGTLVPKSHTPKNEACETVATMLPMGNIPPDANAVPRLPWQLEGLLRAANSDVLPRGMTHLESGLVFDLRVYVLASAASYLLGDRDAALTRLWQAHRKWQETR